MRISSKKTKTVSTESHTQTAMSASPIPIKVWKIKFVVNDKWMKDSEKNVNHSLLHRICTSK
jgi:hypothetical protein